MADAPEGSELKDLFAKKIGPLPVAVWAGAFIVIWYVVSKKQKSAASTTSTTAATSGTSEPGTYGTDPAGNSGLINPSTGYVYGTPEDLAAEESISGATSSSSGTSTTATYTTNNAWAVAAINYLVGLGDDPTAANDAVEAYLSAQTLSTSQQAMVNSAILAIGAPPQPPEATTTTTTVTNPPGGSGVYATNPPTGVAVSNVTKNSATIKWNASPNATGYNVTYTATGKGTQTQSTGIPAIILGSLTPGTRYAVTIQATPADSGAGSATTNITTPAGVTSTPMPNPVTGGPLPVGRKT